MEFEPGQIVATRGGSTARIYAVNAGGSHGVHGAWYNEIEEVWIPCSWDAEGYFVSGFFPRSVDIIKKDTDGLQVEI